MEEYYFIKVIPRGDHSSRGIDTSYSRKINYSIVWLLIIRFQG